MKLKCIKARTDASNGLFGIGAHGPEPIEGLTEGKVYDAQVLNTLSYGGNMSVSNSIEFLLYNDNSEWETYDLNLFSPI